MDSYFQNGHLSRRDILKETSIFEEMITEAPKSLQSSQKVFLDKL